MQSVLIYFPSEAYPLTAYKDEELGLCLVPTNKLNPYTRYYRPQFATAFIHYDKIIDIEKTKNLLKDLIIFKSFLYKNYWLNMWYSQYHILSQAESVNNISSIDNLIKSICVPHPKDGHTVDYSKYKLLELISKPVTVDFFPLFRKYVSLTNSKKDSQLRRLIELFSFASSSVNVNRLYRNEYFSISVYFIILEVLVKDKIKNNRKVVLCPNPNCGYEKKEDRPIKELISEYILTSDLIHPDEIIIIEKLLHKFADVRNFFFHSGRMVNQDLMFERVKQLKGSVSFNNLDDIDIADGTVMGIWTMQTFVRRVLLDELEKYPN